MVLKKPYAFLIKHFKLIHLILFVPLVYLILKTGAIAKFFSEYVAANYYTNLINIPGIYINYFMYLAILVILLLVLAVYFLMRQKEKDTKFYLFLMMYYILLFALLSFCHSILGSIESAEVTAQTVRMYRDISYIVYIPQFFFAIYTLLRGIGFDLKKFNFDEDAKELEITDLDDEEFELTFGKDAYKYKRTIRRFIREFKYYVLENRITFTILSCIIVVILGTVVYLNFGVYHKTYRQTQKISHNNLIVTVEDSVLSNMDLGGNIINKDNYYLAVSMKIKNNSKAVVTLDYENFKLEIASRLITATLDRTNYFADFGIPYTRETRILAGQENVYVFTYEVPNELIDKKMSLKILESMSYDIGSVTPIYKTVNLRYETISSNDEVRTIDFGKILELSETKLGMVQIKLKKTSIVKSFEYSYQSCQSSGFCQTLKNKVNAGSGKYLLVLERDFSIDTYTNYFKSRKGDGSFTKDFVKVRYLVNQSKKEKVVDITPKELKNYWVFQVPEEIKDASDVELLINLRGSIYVMKTK